MQRLLFFILCVFLSSCGDVQPEGESRDYKIGRDSSWFPLQIGAKGANVTAFTNALFYEISHSLDRPMQIVELGAGELVQSMHDKQVSAILLACTKEERERRYRFSDPLLPLGPVLITPIQAHISSLQELAGKVLAIYQFDDSVLIGQQYPSLILRTYQSMPLVLEGLATGDIDGVLMPAFHAHNLVYPLYASRLSIVTPPLNTYAIYLLTSPDAPAHLIEQVNHSLQQLISNGTYSRLARAFQLYD